MLFISPLKLLSFSRYLSFCDQYLVVQKSGLTRKIRLILKFMTSQPTQQTIAIHILANISRSKDNQTIKFGQFIVYNMRNIFVEKSSTKFGRETIPRPLSKKSKLCISLDQQCKVLNNLFLLHANFEGYSKYSEIKLQAACFYLI